jgi:hypothetical protein
MLLTMKRAVGYSSTVQSGVCLVLVFILLQYNKCIRGDHFHDVNETQDNAGMLAGNLNESY